MPSGHAPFVAATPAGIKSGRRYVGTSRLDIPDWIITSLNSAASSDKFTVSGNYAEEIWMETHCKAQETKWKALPRVQQELSDAASSATSSQVPTPRSMEPSPRGITTANRANASLGTAVKPQIEESGEKTAQYAVVEERQLSLIEVDLDASTPDARKWVDFDMPTAIPVIPPSHPQPLPKTPLGPMTSPPLVEPPQTILDTFCQFFYLFQSQACCRPAALPEQCAWQCQNVPEPCASQCREGRRPKRQSIGEVQFVASRSSSGSTDRETGPSHSRDVLSPHVHEVLGKLQSHDDVHPAHLEVPVEPHSITERRCSANLRPGFARSSVQGLSLADSMQISTRRSPPCGGA